MNRIFFGALLIGFLLILGFNVDSFAQPQIKAQTVIDLGPVSEQGGPHNFEILVQNQGKQNALLLELQSGCGCTSSSQKFPISLPANSKIYLPLVFNPLGKSGFFYKQIMIKVQGFPEPLVVDVRGQVVRSGIPLEYVAHFGYDQDNFDTLGPKYMAFAAGLAAFSAKPLVYVRIESSASYVPTRLYSTNDALALARSDRARALVLKAMAGHHIDTARVRILPAKTLVGGPVYQNDYKKSASKYEPFQYVKLSVF